MQPVQNIPNSLLEVLSIFPWYRPIGDYLEYHPLVVKLVTQPIMLYVQNNISLVKKR